MGSDRRVRSLSLGRRGKGVRARPEFGETIYVAIGSVGRQSTPKLQYVGITKDSPTRPNTAHPIRWRIEEDGPSLYLGDVTSQAVSSQRPAHHSKAHFSLLDLGEDSN